MSSGMTRRTALGMTAMLFASWVAGCSLRAPNASLSGANAPLTLRDLQLSSANGHHAVLLRLSRVPDAVRYSSSSSPAQIVVEAYGPASAGDLADKVLPQDDPYVQHVRVSREGGALRIVIQLYGDQPPAHQVHEMADWLMVRLGESGQP